MRTVMIVDDEQTIRNGLSFLISRINEYSVNAVCATAAEALKKITKLSPDIVFTDIRMPEMDGFSFIDACRRKGRHPKFIIISGYDEFEYARKAHTLNTFDFLLKPINHKHLIDVLRRAAELLDVEERTKEQKSREIGILALQGTKASVTLAEALAHEIGYEFKKIQVMVLDFGVSMNTVDGLYDEDRRKIADILNAHSYQNPILVIHNNLLVIIVDCLSKNVNLIDTIGREIVRSAAGAHNKNVRLGIGGICTGLGNCSISYEQAKRALDFSIVDPERRVYSFKPEELAIGNINIYLEKDLSMIAGAIRSRNTNELLRNINVFFDRVQKESIPVPAIIEYYKRTVAYFQSVIGVKTSEQANAEINTSLGNRSLADLRSDLLTMASDTMEQLSTSEALKYGQLINSIISYINIHYMEDLKESKLCKEFLVHASYFCKLFKEKTGITFKQYLTHIRIAKAKELLRFEQYKVYEIASLVGFENPKYFSRIFRAETGVTPWEYKNSLVIVNDI
ncbi:MAG: response regulator [Spirochaetota bacterium]